MNDETELSTLTRLDCHVSTSYLLTCGLYKQLAGLTLFRSGSTHTVPGDFMYLRLMGFDTQEQKGTDKVLKQVKGTSDCLIA